MKDSAKPLGFGCTANENLAPYKEPSPRSLWNEARSSEVVMIRISRIPARKRVPMG